MPVPASSIDTASLKANTPAFRRRVGSGPRTWDASGERGDVDDVTSALASSDGSRPFVPWIIPSRLIATTRSVTRASFVLPGRSA